MPNNIIMHMHCSITIFMSVVLYNAIVEDCILVYAYYYVHMLTIPIDECCYYCFALMGADFSIVRMDSGGME